MGMEHNCGRMVPVTKVNGAMTKLTARENWYTPMEMFTKVIGSMIKQKGKVSIRMRMVLFMKANGKMTSSTDKVSNRGQMAPGTKEHTRTARRRDKEDLPLLMEASIRVNFTKTKSLDTETTTGQTANHMLAAGPKTKWTVMVFSPGKMARSTRVTSSTIREKDMELSCGLMADSTSVNGKVENSMASDTTSAKTDCEGKASGSTDGNRDG